MQPRSYDSRKPALLTEALTVSDSNYPETRLHYSYNVASGRQSMTHGLLHDAAATCVVSRVSM